MTVICSICCEGFKQPIALPCGHVFCEECLSRTIQVVQGIATAHMCPSCRAVYNPNNANQSAAPHLKGQTGNGLRRLYMQQDDVLGGPRILAGEQLATEVARLRAENAVLQQQCALWRRRAEAHTTITSRLLQLVQLAESQAVTMKHERDSLEEECTNLKRKRSTSVSSKATRRRGTRGIKPQVATHCDSPPPTVISLSSRENSPASDVYDRPAKRSRQC